MMHPLATTVIVIILIIIVIWLLSCGGDKPKSCRRDCDEYNSERSMPSSVRSDRRSSYGAECERRSVRSDSEKSSSMPKSAKGSSHRDRSCSRNDETSSQHSSTTFVGSQSSHEE